MRFLKCLEPAGFRQRALGFGCGWFYLLLDMLFICSMVASGEVIAKDSRLELEAMSLMMLSYFSWSFSMRDFVMSAKFVSTSFWPSCDTS